MRGEGQEFENSVSSENLQVRTHYDEFNDNMTFSDNFTMQGRVRPFLQFPPPTYTQEQANEIILNYVNRINTILHEPRTWNQIAEFMRLLDIEDFITSRSLEEA